MSEQAPASSGPSMPSMSGMTQSLNSNNSVTDILTGFTIVLVLYFALSMCEYLYKTFAYMRKEALEVFPHTYPSGSKSQVAVQNPMDQNAKTITFSDNQRSGVEFSYSMFINVSSDTFSSGNHVLYHILHKGYSKAYPLMSPGIFCWGDKNTIRIYMNSFNTWNDFVDIDNIPVNNWFHLVVSCKGNVLYVYVNGNLKRKLSLSGKTPPYQNYGNVYMFSSRKLTLRAAAIKSLDNDPAFKAGSDNVNAQTILNMDGSAKGLVSRVFYYRYALTYSEIQTLMNMGPSSKVVGSDASVMTPYLSDTWWTTNGTRI